MKRILFLFTASLLFLACSNDDNNGSENPQELKIKKFSKVSVDLNGNPTGNSTVYFFDENGRLSQKKEDEANSDYTRIINYNYNQLGRLTESVMIFEGVNGNRSLEYTYDSENKLDFISESFDGGTPDIYFQLTHQPNKISIEHRSPGFYTTLNYNSNILTSIHNEIDMGGFSTESLYYDAVNNIMKRPSISNTRIYGEPDILSEYTYQYDTKINPLHTSFNENHLDLLGQYWFNLNYWKPFLSPNNFTGEVYTNSQFPEDNYTLLKIFQYNTDGYPTSAVVKKDGTLIEELTYEYY
tara:strand:- start:23136 stop:24026 length:891 start_codon:yes stop_codon:yes gene_type:complete